MNGNKKKLAKKDRPLTGEDLEPLCRAVTEYKTEMTLVKAKLDEIAAMVAEDNRRINLISRHVAVADSYKAEPFVPKAKADYPTWIHRSIEEGLFQWEVVLPNRSMTVAINAGGPGGGRCEVEVEAGREQEMPSNFADEFQNRGALAKRSGVKIPAERQTRGYSERHSWDKRG